MAQAQIQTRLCPHCANSITLDALKCPYCRADLLPSTEPEWPHNDEYVERSNLSVEKERLTVKSKAILALGLVVFALGVYLVGGNRERSDLRPVLEEQQRTLQDKDATIKDLEAQLTRLRQEQQGSKNEIEQLNAQLRENSNDLVAVRKNLTEANHQIDQLAASRNAGPQRSAARATEQPASVATTASVRGRGGLEPGTYETTRSVSVYEEPASSSRVVTQIGKGTQLTVVRFIGDWVEIRSKHGNPPGFIRAADVAGVSPSR